MKFTLILIGIFTISLTAIAQESVQPSRVSPVAIEKETLSGLNIPPFKLRLAPEREYYQKTLFNGTDLMIFILASETAENKIEKFAVEEFVYYLNGKAEIKLPEGSQMTFLKGDYIFVPKGFNALWTNHGGSKTHLELSVISKKRAPSNAVSKPTAPFLLDREKLSGFGLSKVSKTETCDVLFKGIEIEIGVRSNTDGFSKTLKLKTDAVFQVLSGAVSVTGKGSSPKTFFSGDFFVLPRGFEGEWKSLGQNARTLQIESAID